ncbi:MAG TPA: hypothetical protein VNZ67_12835, partial [bacterium]|nr:hypothetical protein [bacterium]
MEFDIFTNNGAPFNDPPYDSLGLQLGGGSAAVVPRNCGGSNNITGTCGRPAISPFQSDVKDGLDHLVEIQWTAGATSTLAVSVDGGLRAQWQFDAATVNAVFNGGNVWYGFTAASGGATNVQEAGQASSSVSVLGCQATPTPGAYTPLPNPTNNCGNPTAMPSFTPSPSSTPNFTATASPTSVPPVCGAPSLVDHWNWVPNVSPGNACYSSSNTATYTNPGGANTLMLVRVENGVGTSVLPYWVGYAGRSLSFLRSDPTYSGGNLATYYLVNPPSGANSLVLDYVQGACNFNVVVEVYAGVDQSNPIGAASTSTGNTSSFCTSLTSTGPASLLSDFFALGQSNVVTFTLGGGQTSFGYNVASSGCCETIYGDYTIVGSAGSHTLTYSLSLTKPYTSQLVEVRGPFACTPTNTPTFTASPTPTYTITNTYTVSPTPTFTITNTYTVSPTPTFTIT